MEYKFEKVSKVNIRKQLNNKEVAKRDFISFTKLLDKKILICNSNNIKMYSFPTFKLINLINTPSSVFSVTLLKSKNIACCQHNGKISIYSMSNNKLKLKQTLDVLNEKTVFRVKELPNNMLVSCQDEQSINFYKYNERKKNMLI